MSSLNDSHLRHFEKTSASDHRRTGNPEALQRYRSEAARITHLRENSVTQHPKPSSYIQQLIKHLDSHNYNWHGLLEEPKSDDPDLQQQEKQSATILTEWARQNRRDASLSVDPSHLQRNTHLGLSPEAALTSYAHQDTLPEAGPSLSREALTETDKIDKDAFVNGMRNMQSDIETLKNNANQGKRSYTTTSPESKLVYEILYKACNQFLLSEGLVKFHNRMPYDHKILTGTSIDYALDIKNNIAKLSPNPASSTYRIRSNIDALYKNCKKS